MDEPSESETCGTSEGFSVSIGRTVHSETAGVTTSHGTSVIVTRGRNTSTGSTRKEPPDATDKGKAYLATGTGR